MPLNAGTRLGSYEILDPIGAGGMGEVYRARDTKLGRDVAIKALPEEFSLDRERRSRFEREAKLLASLNHTNIATLHGLEESGGQQFLVMELVEGETLAERIARGPVPVSDALPLFNQIAEGLDAAHEKGVIHRDLKPANIKVTPEGKPKILDFGLAKARAEEPLESNLSESPTFTRGTAAGVILGTAPYMSPEQARGKAVDKRTDIWAFGCCLYEALTGKAAFAGDTVSDIIAAILGKEPPIEALASSFQELVARCLDKNPRTRLRDIGELYLLNKKDAPQPKTRRASVPRIAGWGVAVAIGFILARAFAPETALPSRDLRRYTIPLPHSVTDLQLSPLAVSPDGAHLAYVAAPEDSARKLVLLSLENGSELLLPGTEGARFPFFSPDGEWIGFTAGGRIKKISVRGGAPFEISEGNVQWGASWGSDETIVFRPAQRALMRVPAEGGVPEPIPDTEDVPYHWPFFVPGQEKLLARHVRGGLSVLSLETGTQRDLGIEGNVPKYLPSGHLLFARAGSLFAVPFELETESVVGTPVPVLDGVRQHRAGGSASYSVTSEGTLVYVSGSRARSERGLVWVSRDGTTEDLMGDRRVFAQPRLSPDGRYLAVSIGGERSDIWLYHFGTEALRRFTLDGESESPVWSRDSKGLAVASFQNREIHWKLIDGSEERVLVESSGEYADPEAWSPDGRVLAFSQNSPATGWDIWTVHVGDGSEPEVFENTSAYEAEATFSPDGRWIAYISAVTGVSELYIGPYPGPGERRQVSEGGARGPLWLRTGEIVYRSGDRMLSVAVQTAPELRISRPTVLFEGAFDEGGGYRAYDASPDGERFVMIPGDPAPDHVRVIVNWTEELKRLVPTYD